MYATATPTSHQPRASESEYPSSSSSGTAIEMQTTTTTGNTDSTNRALGRPESSIRKRGSRVAPLDAEAAASSSAASLHPSHTMSSPSSHAQPQVQTINVIKADINKEKGEDDQDDGTFKQRIVGPMGRHVCIGMDVFDVLLCVVWLGAIAVMIWYTDTLVKAYHQAQANPTTSIGYETHTQETLPTTTICNWNAATWNSDTNSYDYMPYNNLTLLSCTNLTTVTPDNPSPDPCKEGAFKYVHYIGINSNQSFSCWQFNVNEDEAAIKTGYMGGFSVLFAIVEDYITMDDSYRVGIQISFGRAGSFVDADNEYNFLPAGQDSFYALQKRINYYLDGSSTVAWAATSTTTDLPRSIMQYDVPITTFPDGSEQELNTTTNSYPNITLASDQPIQRMPDGKVITGRILPVAVTFGYHTLAVEIVTEQITFSFEEFIGAFGGMLGLLMGIDLIKLFRSAFLVPHGCMEKSLRDAFEMMN